MELENLTIVIPTLNAAASLPATLAALRGSEAEIIIVDGGSTDATVALAEAAGHRLIASARGRGVQLAIGVQAATRDWLLLLHADTVPGEGWSHVVGRFIADPRNADRTGVFRFATDLPGHLARSLERTVNWRSRVMAMPYGDQGLLIRRNLLDRVGGVRPLPIMEDVDLVRRLGRDRLTMLEATAVTSGARYGRHGILPRVARNMACLGLYYVGVSPTIIARLYG